MPKKQTQAEAKNVDVLDRDPQADPEWLAGLPADVRKAHDRYEAARGALREAEERKWALIAQAHEQHQKEIAEAQEFYALELQRAQEQLSSTENRLDAELRQRKHTAAEQYDQAQMQVAQALQRWQDAQRDYLVGVVRKGEEEAHGE